MLNQFWENSTIMRIFLLSPYHSGSHKAWAEGVQKHSNHHVEIFSLPGQLWKWRMHGSAVTLAKQVLEQDTIPDLVITDDMLDLATFAALTRRRLAGVPLALYMHENQLLYPLPQDKKKGPMRRNWGVRERQYVLINWKSMLAADKIFFNSRFHLEALFAELPVFLRHYPDHNEEETVELLRQKSAVLPVGIDFADVHRQSRDVALKHEARNPGFDSAANLVPTILWNQRWEFDKNPAEFFATLRQFKAEGGVFNLIVCGESFQKTPEAFEQAEAEFKNEIIHFGFASKERYQELLGLSDIVISTAHHEFFGISILEAIHAGAIPLLPKRLSYPELIPAEYHAAVLYNNRYDLISKLHQVTAQINSSKTNSPDMQSIAKPYSWTHIIGQYDQEFEVLTHIN
ncbi:MAG: DUF3524 domain-containing protein [Anaerolineae bacterium]